MEASRGRHLGVTWASWQRKPRGAKRNAGHAGVKRPSHERHGRRRPRQQLVNFALLAPALVLVFGLVVYPVVYDVALALTDAHGFEGEFDTISGGIGMAAAPLVLACAAFAPAYVRGLRAAMIEGS